MARTVFLMLTVGLGFVLLREHGWILFDLDEQMAWALLLPGVYLAGLGILRD